MSRNAPTVLTIHTRVDVANISGNFLQILDFWKTYNPSSPQNRTQLCV